MSMGDLQLPTPMDQEQGGGVAPVIKDLGSSSSSTTTTTASSEAADRAVHMSTDSRMEASTVMQLEDFTKVVQFDGRQERSGGGGGGGVDACDQEEKESASERLNRHRREMAGRVWIPETWGKEELLKEWSDCPKFDRSLFPKGLLSAREALVEECRRANAGGVRRTGAIRNSCS